MSEQNKILLPQGFHDHLPPEASTEVKLNNIVVKTVSLFGYELVRPAMMEFEESLDKDFTSDFFKVTDTISGKMMVIRNDITPQIARIVKDRYGSDALKKTIRLAYTGQVIRRLGKGKFTERQLTQAGYELISENSAKRDAEILFIAIEAYQNAGIKDFTIDLCYPKLSKVLFNEKMGFEDDEILRLMKLIESKDIQALKYNFGLMDIHEGRIESNSPQMPEHKSDLTNDAIKIITILDNAIDLKSAINCLKQLEAEISLKEAVQIFSRTREVLEILAKSVPTLKISLNLLEVMGFHYHNGLCYSFISGKNFDEVGRGGRYKISLSKESNLSAAGFTFLINSMLRSVNIEQNIETKKISYEEGFSKSKSQREKNITTIFE